MTALAPRVDSTRVARDLAPFDHPLHSRSSALTRRAACPWQVDPFVTGPLVAREVRARRLTRGRSSGSHAQSHGRDHREPGRNGENVSLVHKLVYPSLVTV